MKNGRAGKIVIPLMLMLAGGLIPKQIARSASAEEAVQYVRATPSMTGALHVEGTHLAGSDGTLVQLTGISTHGIAWYPDYINEECFRQLHEEWKVNVIRLAMYTAEPGGYCTDGDKEYLKELVCRGVQYAAEQDMYVIVDWHILSDYDPNMNREEAKAFFEEMSKRFADYDNVLYEICNEPNGDTGWSEIKAYAEEIIGVIRSNDSDAVILVGTPNWSQYVDEAAADPIEGYENIMYTLHFYAATHKEELRSKMTAAVDAGLPVFVTEYGICDASGSGAIDEEQANTWVETMNRYGISYAAWNLSNKDETSAILKTSYTGVSGFTREDLSDSGRWLYGMLTGAAPLPTEEAQDGTEPEAGEEPDSGSESVSADGPAGAAELTAQEAGGISVQSENGAELTAELSNTWESEGETYSQYTLKLQNNTDISYDSWEIVVTFQEEFELSDGWNGDYAQEGNALYIRAKDYNSTIPGGGSVSDIGFIVKGGGDMEAVVCRE